MRSRVRGRAEGRPGLAIRVTLYAAVLAVASSSGLLFDSGGSVTVRILGAALAGMLAGSAGSWRFALLLPAAPLYGVIAAYGPVALNPFGFFGDSGLLAALESDVPVALATMYNQPIPYEVQPGLVFLLAPVVVLLAGISVSATLYEDSPVFTVAILGVSLGAVSTFNFEAGVGPYFAAFLAAAVGLILLTAGSGAAGLGIRGIVAGLAVIAAALALPQTPLSGAVIRPALVDWTQIGAGETSRLATEADVGPYLNTGRDAELMLVRSPEPLYWRGGTLDKFDGVRWSSTLNGKSSGGQEIAPGVKTETVRQSVQILHAKTNLVFGGYNIQDTSLPYAEPRADGSWSVDGKLQQGERYGVVSKVPQPTRKQLEQAGTGYSKELRSRYLQMPGDSPKEIAQTAKTIRRDYAPQTPYETARAIQRYLLYDGGFTYNLNVNYRRADQALAEFLGGNREGFCTQFATSMALVAREMGVPTRVVYGATAGEQVGDGEYLVRGANMHTWVEAYFPGVGWYPFDPTPGLGVTSAMEKNAPAPDSGGSSPAQDVIARSPAMRGDSGSSPVTRAETTTPASAGNAGVTQGRGAGPLAYALPIAFVLISFLSVPFIKGALLGRGRPGDYYRDVTGRLEDCMPGRSRPPASLTPSEKLSALARSAGLPEEPFIPLAEAYSEHLYARHPASDPASAHAGALDAYRTLPRWRRAFGAMNPASLARRGSASLSRRPKVVSWPPRRTRRG